MPVTSIDSSNALTTKDAFAGNFGTLSGIKSDDTTKLEYTAIGTDGKGTVESGTDAYTATVNGTETNGVYYNFQIDYMITKGKTLKVTATDVKATTDGTTEVESGKPSIAQAARVGIMPASSVTVGTGDTKDFTAATYGKGKEYTIAAPADQDYNLEELKALGYTGSSEYKSGLTRLDINGVTFASSSLATTTDGAFEYGSLNIYVWFDGTDKACTNAIFSQTLTMSLTFIVTD